jgi:eukaryotic-like serine/threonine-protein kinase
MGNSAAVQLIDGRYELLEVIASGGMATVWRARDTRLDRLVALKRPHPAPPSDDHYERMAREARVAASLNHPNLITVHDVGSDDSGPYLVMELVDGPTLLEVGDDLDVVEVMAIGEQVADALHTIHSAGIVHRDVKPANIIMSGRGPLLTDFGIASGRDEATITAEGKVVATPSYAAPEVLAGEKPTPAADVFALGVTIRELLEKTGQPSGDFTTALGPALSESPHDRPDAAGFAAALRLAAPTMTVTSSGDSTLVLEASPPQRADDEDDDPAPIPAWVWAAGALVVVGLALALIGLALSDPDTPADAAVAVSTSSTTSLKTTTSSSTSTSTTAAEPTVEQTRNELEAVLLQTPRSDLKPHDVEDLMKKVDEAIEAREEGDTDKAEKKLSEVAEKIDDKVEEEKRAEASLLIAQLADLLGVDLQPGDDDDD